MKHFLKIKLVLAFCIGKMEGQNLILNSSFSDVKPKHDSGSFYAILPGIQSEVNNWYLPDYIDYRPKGRYDYGLPYPYTYYYTNRDKSLSINKGIFSNVDQLMEDNLGFVSLAIDNLYPIAIIQQQLKQPLKKGTYCFKFKYKSLAWQAANRKGITLDFCFSNSNLKEYYKKNLSVPALKKQIIFEDTAKNRDENMPWQQQCFIINLHDNEQFLSIGTLSDKTKSEHVLSKIVYFIDDIELFALKPDEICPCEIINRDLRQSYNREFPLNTELTNDTLIMFRPMNNWSPNIITPPTKHYLNEVIAFLQRHPDINIHFIEHNPFNNVNMEPTYYWAFRRYITYFGIESHRISAKCGTCIDTTNGYCRPTSEYVRIGVGFYKR